MGINLVSATKPVNAEYGSKPATVNLAASRKTCLQNASYDSSVCRCFWLRSRIADAPRVVFRPPIKAWRCVRWPPLPPAGPVGGYEISFQDKHCSNKVFLPAGDEGNKTEGQK